MSQIEPREPRGVDDLIDRLGQVENGDAFWAARELGKHGELERKAIGPLRRLAESTKGASLVEGYRFRAAAMAAISAWRLDESSPYPSSLITLCLPTGAIPPLQDYENEQYEIVRSVGELGSTAHEAVPVLRRLRNRGGNLMRDYAEEALQAIAPECFYDPWRK